MEPQHYHEDLAAFALDSLDPDERKAVESHIAACVSCRLIAEEARCIVDQLALIAPCVRPTPQLKQRLMAQIAADRVPRRRQLPLRSWRALGAAMATALLVLVVVTLQMNSRMNRLAHQQSQLTSQLSTEWKILAHYDGVSRRLAGTSSAPAARGTVFIQPNSAQAMLVVDGLAPLPSDKVYRCWLVRNGLSYLVASFGVSEEGHAGVVLQARESLQSYNGLIITVEPDSEAAEPQGETVLSGDF